MLSWLLSSLLSLAATYGPVVLFAIFLLEGALIGKVIPTRALFVAVVVAVGTSVISLVSVIALAVVGATLGQCLLFVLVRYIDYRPGYSSVDNRFVNRAEEWFEQGGYPAVAITNTLPVLRGSLTVPVALGTTSTPRFFVASFLGTTFYVTGLTVVAVGLLELI